MFVLAAFRPRILSSGSSGLPSPGGWGNYSGECLAPETKRARFYDYASSQYACMEPRAAQPQPNGAKRLECAQLAAAFNDPRHSRAAASCTHSKRFATMDAGKFPRGFPSDMDQQLTTDVLILGAGGAGLMAALHAFWRNPSLDITVVAKGLLGKSGCTRMVQGGYNVALDPKDSVQAHFEDTVRGGAFLNDQELAWTLVEDAPRIVRELENRIGCLFDRGADGRIHQKAFAGQSFDRTVHVGDLTGIEIMARLRDQVFATGIRYIQSTRGLELLTSKDRSGVIGAILLDIETGDYIVVQAKAVILCTGAGPLMYQRSACAQEKAMDGLAMAFRAGATLMDMEMVQFHPTGMVVPGSRLNGALLEEGLRGAGAHLFNGSGERFMVKYDPERMERSTRDRVSRASYMEVMAGRGSENGGVWIDVSHLGAEFVERNFAGMRDRCLRVGFDLAREKVEVCPTAHFHMGGVRIDRDGFTNLEGLMAAGEDAGGVHGANRLGGNGVAESTVYGARAGDAVAAYVAKRSHGDVDESQIADAKSAGDQFLGRSKGEDPWPLRDELGKVMWESVGIVRSEAKLKTALAELETLAARCRGIAVPGGRRFNLTWQQALDLRNLLPMSHFIATAAHARQDSRGAHYREDFPKADNDQWLQNICFQAHRESFKMWTEPVKLTRLAP
jgi:succinate dehydrogenase / fumarate reductase flavoprotein subunit/fumarate reductase flavoprotein subunit